ncbi:hypothetical protein DCCM_4663 [Desulfocucumis palustris]|uniref:Uncharacterized protein n=1 Tax=Desulfocucumis palustris TaxID=1898651 RepID=A0A2L2XHS8_9FIRM|nr:hypothetical protein [Desulfocucumis palustris]GBF35534.1 hypothetical protein DCCM_4663 [Desulfocucumis palustris]
MIYDTTKLTSQGELALTKDIMDVLKLDQNTGLVIYLEDNQIVLKKVSRASHQNFGKPTCG